MTGTFIDTIIVCTMTGLAIVMTGAWDMGLEGVAVTTKAFALDFHSCKSISICINDVSGILCIYNNSWMGIL